MPKNYQEKYKAHLDAAFKGGAASPKQEEKKQSKFNSLKSFVCSLDIDNKKDDTATQK